MFWYIFSFIIVWLICGILSSLLFSEKGHSGIAGFWVGFLLGLIGLIYAAGRPNINSSRVVKTDEGETIILNDADETPQEEKYNLCPNCGWQIFEGEESCSNCGYKNSKVC